MEIAELEKTISELKSYIGKSRPEYDFMLLCEIKRLEKELRKEKINRINAKYSN